MIYKIAEALFDVKMHYRYSQTLMKDYVYEGDLSAQCSITFSIEEINKQAQIDDLPPHFSEAFMILREVSKFLFYKMDGGIFHSSAIKVRDKAVLFCAPSGTGKSTHAKLWLSTFDDVSYINDDKPFIRKMGNDFIVFGSPWRGKHDLGENTSAKLGAICIIERAEKPEVNELAPSVAIPYILNQMLRFKDIDDMNKLFSFVECLIASVKVYKLKVNMESDSAVLARKVVLGDL